MAHSQVNYSLSCIYFCLKNEDRYFAASAVGKILLCVHTRKMQMLTRVIAIIPCEDHAKTIMALQHENTLSHTFSASLESVLHTFFLPAYVTEYYNDCYSVTTAITHNTKLLHGGYNRCIHRDSEFMLSVTRYTKPYFLHRC